MLRYLRPRWPPDRIWRFDENGESVFHVEFGENLRGPDETNGYVQVGLVDDLVSERAPRTLTRKGSSDRTFAEAVANLKPTARVASRREGNTENNWAYFGIWTKPNGHPVKELPEVSCSTEGEFPAKASGYQGVKAKMKLRIISTPGDDGTLRVWSDPKSAEANPANDEVKLVVTVGGSDGSDGSGGGLPVTGCRSPGPTRRFSAASAVASWRSARHCSSSPGDAG